ncbi:MAG: prepilin-type N-terminal cleavage/methylation domain-containing protein [Mycobacteriales bacterium]
MERELDAGFTLVEMLIAMVIVFVLLGLTMSVLVASNGTVKTTSQMNNLNEEARQAINRMARDIRQANSIVTAVNPDGPTFDATHIVAVRLKADFDGDNCIGGVPLPGVTPTPTCLAYNSGNPEDITYCYEPTSRQLYVIDNQASPPVTPVSSASTNCSGGQPLLAGNVSGFKVEYRSNNYRFDLNPTDGITTWTELDAAGPPVGDKNGLLDTELPSIDSVVLDVTMQLDKHSQVYRTQVDLRNNS